MRAARVLGPVGARLCAYCGASEALTKEHVFPQFLIEMAGTASFASTRVPRVKAPPTVRDVCRRCNNESLSLLDSQAKSIIDRHMSRAGDPTGCEFGVDFSVLRRWLLKISYNAARITGEQADAHRLFAKYILSGEVRPPGPLDVLLMILSEYPARSDGGGAAICVRVGEVLALPEIDSRLVLRRMVSVNAFVFTLLAWREGVDRGQHRRLLRGLRESNGMVSVPLCGKLKLPAPCPIRAADFLQQFRLGRAGWISASMEAPGSKRR